MQKTLKISVIPLCVAAFIGVSGCAKMQSTDIFNAEKYDHIDKQQKLSRDDYRHMTRPEPKDGKYMPYVEGDPELKVELGEPPVPDISNILAAPRPPKLGETQLIDIFVTEQASLKDTLIELGRIANVDVEIDPSIQGGIVFRAQKRPFNEVIERISSLAGLRYSMENGVLRIERDTPYVETYPLDFLSYSRSSSSEVSVSTSVLSAGGEASGGDGLDTGASSTISYEMEGDFWEQFEATVESILQYAPTTGLSVQSGIDDIPDGQSFFTINRQAGALTVSGTERQQRMVENYIKTMRENMAAQVLIEAKIVEVTLDEAFQSGIDWNQVFTSRYLALDADYNTVTDTGSNITQLLIGADDTGDASLDAIVNLTESFGTSRTLSSPRIHAMNNQQAVLTFAQNIVYFNVEFEREEQDTAAGTQDQITVSSEVQTVPVGILLSLQPSINPRTGEITLSVRPTLSRVVTYRSDPGVAVFLASLGGGAPSIENLIPEIEVRELDSVMRMRSGQVMVLGGLMQQLGINSENGVPFVSGIPWVGHAFKGRTQSEQVKELYFLIKATIVGTSSTMHPADRRIYEKFTTDHRPLAF